MKCPKCGAELTALPVQDIAVDKCQSCDGIWLEYGEIKKLRSSGLARIERELEEEHGNPPTPQAPLDGYLRCPQCVDQGLRSNYISYMLPVRADHCVSCFGIWLDRLELDKLLEDKQLLDAVGNDDEFMSAIASVVARMQQSE